MSEQVTLAFERPVESIPDTRYVKGETRYMKIQNLGMASGPTRTPQKMRQSENMSEVIPPPPSAVSMPAITMFVKVEANKRKARTNRNINPLRSVNWSANSAFRYIPIG